MKKWSTKTTQNFFLAVEALLVMIGVILTGNSVVGMICYWGLVAFYHVMDFLFGAAKDAADDAAVKVTKENTNDGV